MKKTLLFIAVASMVTFSSCGMSCGSQPVVEEQVETVEIDTLLSTPQPDTSVVVTDVVVVDGIK